MLNADQIEYWNGPAGQKWVDQSERLDAMLAPFADAVIAAAALQPGERVLDIGCGAGALTLRAAGAVGAARGAMGVDVSAPLVALARRRAEAMHAPATFELADASVFEAGERADIAVSRFGVMFFEDPAGAFANIRRSVRAGGRLIFVCWQALSANDWAFAPVEAALPFLTAPLPPSDPAAPGPFAFQDKDRLAGVLAQAGWSDVVIEPVETALVVPGEDVEASAAFMMQLGPLARLLATQGLDPAPVHAALVTRLRQHLTPDGQVEMRSACWLATART